MTYMVDKYKNLAEKLGDVSRRLYSHGHIDDSGIVLEARDALMEIYEEEKKWNEDESEPEIEVWFCKSCGRTVRKNPEDGSSAWCPKCWKPYTIQYRKADYFDGSKELSES